MNEPQIFCTRCRRWHGKWSCSVVPVAEEVNNGTQQRIRDLEQQLAAELVNKKQFERDWLEAADEVNNLRQTLADAQEKLAAREARIAELVAALEYENDSHKATHVFPFVSTVEVLRRQDDNAALHEYVARALAEKSAFFYSIGSQNPNITCSDVMEMLNRWAAEWRAKK